MSAPAFGNKAAYPFPANLSIEKKPPPQPEFEQEKGFVCEGPVVVKGIMSALTICIPFWAILIGVCWLLWD